jgi:tRNA pseudouridine55 synthase
MSRRSNTPPRFHGILVVDKPAGWTSHDVVARIRRLLHQRQVGHAGTLDPAATGVLPIAVGSATKVVEYLSDASKSYLAEITFGVETDSHDGDGQLTRLADASALTEDDVREALRKWRGEVDQIPPMHAAIRVAGRRMYERARAGEVVERPARRVVIYRLDLLDWSPPVATLFVDCSKGTYVRALARDLGEQLQVGAYLSDLVRCRTGPFDLGQAWTLEELAVRELEAEWPTVAVHPDVAIERLRALILDDEAKHRWMTGRSIAGKYDDEGLVRVYDSHGDWLGIAEADRQANAWKPMKVIVSAA